MKPLLVLTLTLLLSVSAADAQKTAFSGDSAYAVLGVLVNTIGPRPMGSPAEQRALAFAAEKFRSFGCQESYVMPMTVAAGVNTNSGIAVGVLKGKTDRIILIGGHMDSAGPEIPGANDDGSGAASVIELARVLCKGQHESTIVFCCWGGEEEGLRGSDYFVEHYPRIKDVVLMLQIDMADGSGHLDADPDGEFQISAPTWLVDATFDIFYNDLKSEGLVYPTHAATMNSSTAGGTGSDHMPFLKLGIPAIDFTSDVTYPIHTPLDNWKNFNPAGLARSGDLVLKLFERFDGGVPSRSTESYWLVVVNHVPVFFSHLLLRIIASVAVILGVMVLMRLRKQRPVQDPAARIGFSTLKLLLGTLIVQSFIWLSENVVGIIRGYRYPWVNNFGGFVLLGLLCGLLGLWLFLRMKHVVRLSADPYVYYLRAFIVLLAMIAGLSLANAELGVYPALSLLLLCLALLVRPPVLKALFVLLAPYPLVRLVFSEYVGLLQRLLAQASMETPMVSVMRNGGFILFFTLASIAFVYAFAAVYRSTAADLFWLRKFRGATGLVLSCVGIIATGIYLLLQPVYNETWEQAVRVQQYHVLGSDSGMVSVSSGEYLNGIRLTYDNRDTVLSGRIVKASLPTAQPATVSWLAVNNTIVPAGAPGDTMVSFTRRLTLTSRLRPLQVSVSYRSDREFSASSPWATGMRRRVEKESDRLKSFSWYSFPDSVLVIPVTFTVADTQKISENIEVVYDRLAYPVRMERALTYFTPRTTVAASATFGAPRQQH